MNSEWRGFKVGDLCTVTSSKRIFAHDYVDDGIPFYASKDVIDKALGLFSGATVYISKDRFYEVSRKFGYPLAGDLLLSSVGNRAGISYVVREEGEFYFKDGNITWFKDFSLLNSSFFYYWLKSEFGQSALKSIMIGSAQKALTISGLLGLEIKVPSLKVQGEIVSILKSLDDRINLLRETSFTLEGIAQALFKSWFVDFDPVRAKAEGLEPECMDRATAALFPNSFEDSELGLVPSSWKTLSLEDAYDINPRRKLKKGEMAPYLDMASVGTQGHVVNGVIEREMTSGTKFVSGDTLLARITPCLENGKSAFVDFLSDDQVGWGSTEFVVLRPKAPLPAYHGYLLARHSGFREYAIRSMSGSSGRQRVQIDVLGRYLVIVPSKEIADVFGSIVGSLQQRISANDKQAKCLTQLRDTLLPRLISGQLRLPEATAATEKILSEAV
ncbi:MULTISPECIES: restriction endonuclease subunit S [Pseudomonas chlororaphis group]|uniref:restriction endonuclease subunit S n=1 Tax=Pseudomonas chlororaphis group TaxID=136842 RepID=UPI002097EDFF|nr:MULTISPECIES: restriction endonuclease subunit S [Pseudomonas chlororaphis group]MCO7578853.1 restriction endonuclease subunit S [Pseudomonas protegens]MCO7584654.1 restriction endonuclease subunit S [Pseudomonas chlororaphis]MCO7601939.1 restriction endonuclease subunit S [Pseudomonas chlororaphis]